MALTLGDIDPNLQKKTALQLENERKAQERAKITSQRTFIGEGNDPAKMTAFAPKPQVTDPGKNLKLVQQTLNNYMGPIQTMGQVNPALNQQTVLQQKNAGTPAQQENLSDLAKFARARNESMVNAGITPTPSGTPQPYDTKSAQAQPGYTPTLGGKVNIAPELFYDKYKATDPVKAQLEAKVAEAKSKYPGIVTDEKSLQAYNDYQKALTDLREYTPTISAEQQALAQRSAGELAQTGIGMTSGISTGDARFDSQLGMAYGIAGEDIQAAQEKKRRADELTRQQLINSYMQTNISDLGYNKQDLNKMSLEQLSALASADGLALSNDLKERLSAHGKIQIENEKLARDMQLADVEMTRRQLERNLGRAVQEREDFNTQQDTKLRRMLGMFAGGQVEDLAGNMAVMDYQEKGKQALEDLKVDFADRQDSLGRQYTAISQQYGNNIRMIEGQMAEAIEGAYANLMGKIDGYIAQGVKNEDDLASAITTAKRDYLKFYVDTTNKAAEFMQEQNKTLFDQMITLQKEQRAEDEVLSQMYGVVFRNSKPVIDELGQQIPTFDRMQFNSREDQFLSEQTGVLYRNGQPMLDATGQQIPTMKYMDMQQRFMLDQQKQELEFMKFADQRAGSQQTDMSMYAGQSYLPGAPEHIQNSKYMPTITEDGLAVFNVDVDATGKIANSTRRQCGEYVNDAIGKKVFGNSIQDKRTKITTQVPTAGSAFIQSTNNPYGHVGLVEGVLSTDAQGRPTAIQISDSNYKSKDTFERTVVNISYDKNGNPTYTRTGSKPGKIKIEGFTDSFVGAQPKAQTDLTKMMNKFTASLPSTQRSNAKADIQELISIGDIQGAQDYIRSLAIEKLPSTQRSAYYDFSSLADEFEFTKRSIDPNTATGLYQRLANDTRKYADIAKDQTYSDMMNKIGLAQAQFRNQLFGASLTEGERKIGEAFLISPDDKMPDIIRKIDNMAGYSRRLSENIVNRSMGLPTTTNIESQQPSQTTAPKDTWGITQMATSIRMKAPDGSTVYIPYDQLQEALEAGAQPF